MVFKTVKYFFSISIDMEMVILKHLGEMCNSVVVIQKELLTLSRPRMAVSPECLNYVVVGDGPVQSLA